MASDRRGAGEEDAEAERDIRNPCGLRRFDRHPYFSFGGTTGGASMDVLVKYTYYGDANLDGKVDGSDYSLIDNGYLNQLTGWFNGDFNYDGVVNGSDYTLIDNAFNNQGAQLTADIAGPAAIATAQIAGGTSVPEPASLSVLALGGVALLGRRRRVGCAAGEGQIIFRANPKIPPLAPAFGRPDPAKGRG